MLLNGFLILWTTACCMGVYTGVKECSRWLSAGLSGIKPAMRDNVSFSKKALLAPLALVVWGMAVGVLLWGTGIDVAIQVWLNANYAQNFNGVMRLIGGLGKGSLQAGVCVAAGLAWWLYNWLYGKVDCRRFVDILGAVPVFAFAGGLNWLLKISVGRGRPKEFLWEGTSPYAVNPFELSATWWSFPSGHSCSAFAIGVWLGFAFPRLRYVFWGLAALVSFSRFLALTPHYFGDVVAGGSLGAGVAWAAWILWQYYKREKIIR
jgi:membrane-associated phospholipid phosphatase